MKNLLLVAVSCVIFLTSCRYAECSNPPIQLKYELDTTGFLLFTFDTYEKGSGFSKLISSVPDSAYRDTTYSGSPVTAKQTSVDDKYDYILTIPATGRTYKISDIQYSGPTKVKDDGIVSELRTACTRTVSYTVNGQTFTIEGVTYDIESHASHETAVVTISK